MNILQFGSRGPWVSLLQLGLSRAGYTVGPIDGIFGNATRRGVIAFQDALAYLPNGVVDASVWAALLPYLKGYTVYTVQTGDTLYRIAQAFGSLPGAIETANPHVNPNRIYPGQLLVVPFGYPVVPGNIPYTSGLLPIVLEGLLARYPFLHIGQLGRSVMGTRIPYLTIGSGPTEVFYNAAHHANEWITTPVLLRFLEEYARAYSIGGTLYDTPAQELYRSTTLSLVPMVNPDGVDLVTGAIDPASPEYVRAAKIAADYPSIPFPQGWKANIAGVDLNLQYPAGWEEARAIKFSQGYTSPAPRDYVGASPLSQPESIAVARLTQAHSFALTLSYHTQGRVIYWRYLDYNPPRSYEIASAMANASGYRVEDTPYTSGFAGYKDWFIQEYNRPGYTIEAGLGQNPLPLSQFDTIYKNNLPILTIGLRDAQRLSAVIP